MLTRNAARKLPFEENKNYTGPVHYISHHEVLKLSSSTTPFRIVFNSSAPFNGHILNEYWAKGPDILNNIFGLLLRFREGLIGFIGDLSKMFNSVELSIFDQHVHRFLWRSMDASKKPETYVLTAVPFGDRPSGCIVMLAMKETAKMMKNEYPTAYRIIDEDSYVDDIIHSMDNIDEVRTATKEVEHVLEQASFKIKNWTISDTPNQNNNINLLDANSERVLGMQWYPAADEFCFEVKLNFSAKRRGVRIDANITKNGVIDEIPEIFTKRLVLSQIATIYDPLGLISPFILKGKLLMRTVMTFSNNQGKKLDWDTPLPPDLKEKWLIFFKNIFELENIKIQRCIKLSTSDTNPQLILFCDASMHAYGAAAYVRWQSSDNKFHCNLLASKIRL